MTGVIRIALVGDEMPSHPSHREVNAVRSMLGPDVSAEWVATDSAAVRDLGGYDGVWLLPGSPYADDEAAYAAVTWARTHDVPFLGTCGGLQYAAIEFVRNVLGRSAATHAESDGPGPENAVVALACRLDGVQRLVRPVPGTRFGELMGDQPFTGMHYCGYAPTPRTVELLLAGGMILQATADDAGAEVLELPVNRFFMLSLFQPHIGALAGRPLHPLLAEFVRCARAHAHAPARG